MSGKDYAVILGEMMSQIHQSIVQLIPAGTAVPKVEQQPPEQSEIPPGRQVHVSSDFIVPGDINAQQSITSSVSASSSARGTERRSIAPGDLNPPEVQHCVVEHVVRTSMHVTHRLKPFSGKVPRPNHEMDYDTWRSGVELVLRDPSISAMHHTNL